MTKQQLLDKEYKKIYVLDTNIILNEASNLELLSQNGENLIVLPETVLDEIDSKKSGHDEINFQARQFQRQLQDAKILQNVNVNGLSFINVKISEESTVDLHIISKEKYEVEGLNVDRKILNDRKILEIAKDVQNKYDNLNLIFISLDIMARTRAISIGIEAETLKQDMEEGNDKLIFNESFKIPNFEGNTSFLPEIDKHISNIEVIDTTDGKPYYYYKSGINWKPFDDKNTKKDPSTPRGMGQKALSNLILDDTNDIIVVSGPAGTGKNYVTLGAATRLIDVNKDKYEKIIYIRKTIISGNKDDELGFLPGDLTEKMSGYIQPMESSIKRMVMNKAKRKLTKEELTENITKFKNKYEIEYIYSGHARGDTFDEGSIVILDESQNWDRPTIKTLISRIGENSKLLILGSNNQIDTPYLGKMNNALTFAMGQVGKENSSNLNIVGCNLTNVIRSKYAEWADIALAKD